GEINILASISCRDSFRSSVERQSAGGRYKMYKIARSYVSRIENGVARNPSKDKLIGLATGLGVPEESRRVGIRGCSRKVFLECGDLSPLGPAIRLLALSKSGDKSPHSKMALAWTGRRNPPTYFSTISFF